MGANEELTTVNTGDFQFREDNEIGTIIMDLTTLTPVQRLIFAVFVIVLAVGAVLSNSATLVVGVKSRKIRPFFRTCLICLATSDLLSSTFSAVTYMSQFAERYVQVWTLGSLMCSLAPFMNTVAILANSLTLVGIAMDRYLSVIRLMRNVWDTKGVYCLIFAVIIWGLSVGIATPTLTAYKHLSVLIIELDPENNTQITAMIPAYLCAASKKDNAKYYMILLCIITIPIVLAFVWFNSILAYEIWNRRKAMNRKVWSSTAPALHMNSFSSLDSDQESKTSTTPPAMRQTTSESSPDKSSRTKSSRIKEHRSIRLNSSRDSRQLRMFTIIILLMIMFIAFRLPVWIYLIMKFHNNFLSTLHWILQYCFGILSLFGCAINPFLYAFLAQTIQYAVSIYKKGRRCCGLSKFFIVQSNVEQVVNEPTPKRPANKMEVYVIARR